MIVFGFQERERKKSSNVPYERAEETILAPERCRNPYRNEQRKKIVPRQLLFFLIIKKSHVIFLF